jgi:hypothetical protein
MSGTDVKTREFVGHHKLNAQSSEAGHWGRIKISTNNKGSIDPQISQIGADYSGCAGKTSKTVYPQISAD